MGEYIPSRSDQADAPALCFSGPQDAINFARNGVKNANGGTALNPIDLVKLYEEGKFDIVLKVSTGFDSGEYDLIFSAVKNGHGRVPPAQGHGIDFQSTSSDAHGDEESVFVGVTELVQGPEGVIPSLMRVERAKERADFHGEVFAAALSDTIQISNRVPKGKVGVSRLNHPGPKGYGVATLIEGGSERFNGLGSRVTPTVGDFARKLESMGGVPVSFQLGKLFAWFLFEETADTLFKQADVTLAAS